MELLQIVFKLISIPFLFYAISNFTALILTIMHSDNQYYSIITGSISFGIYLLAFFILFIQPKWFLKILGKNIPEIKFSEDSKKAIIECGICIISIYFIFKYSVYLITFVFKYAISFNTPDIKMFNEPILKEAINEISSLIAIIAGLLLIKNRNRIVDSIFR